MQNPSGKKYVKTILNARYGRIGRPGPSELRKLAVCTVEPMTAKERASWVHNIGKLLRKRWQSRFVHYKEWQAKFYPDKPSCDLGELHLNILLDLMEIEALNQVSWVYELRRRLML